MTKRRPRRPEAKAISDDLTEKLGQLLCGLTVLRHPKLAPPQPYTSAHARSDRPQGPSNTSPVPWSSRRRWPDRTPGLSSTARPLVTPAAARSYPYRPRRASAPPPTIQPCRYGNRQSQRAAQSLRLGRALTCPTRHEGCPEAPGHPCGRYAGAHPYPLRPIPPRRSNSLGRHQKRHPSPKARPGIHARSPEQHRKRKSRLLPDWPAPLGIVRAEAASFMRTTQRPRKKRTWAPKLLAR